MGLPAGEPVVVVGASLAGFRAARALRGDGHQGSLTLIGAEAHWPPYDRPPLSKQVLAGDADVERARIRVPPDLDLDLVLRDRADTLDLEHSEVVCASGRRVGFSGLVVATGAEPRHLPGMEGMAGVHVLRSADDVIALRADLEVAARVIVIGAGFIGCEVASSCRRLGLAVTMVDALDTPLAATLGPVAGSFVRDLLLANAVTLHLGAGVAEIVEESGVRTVVLTDGTVLAADVVVVGIGVAPNTAWLEGSGLHLEDGVLCDSSCLALGGDGRIAAAGDVARWEHPRYGSLRTEHWTNAVEQGAHAARALLHGPSIAGAYAPTPYFWSDQFGVKLQFVGIAGPGDDVAVVEGAMDVGHFVLAYGRDGITIGVLCVGCPRRLVAWQAVVDAAARFPPEVPPG